MELGAHQRFSIPLLWATSLVMVLAAVLLGSDRAVSAISLSRVVRIGAGAGYSGDRIEPAIELAERAHIDYLVFECLAERTIALAQQERQRDPARGYDPFLEARMRAVLPACRRRGIRIVTNAGAANPIAAARAVAGIARELGLRGLRVAAVVGDDVLALVQRRAGSAVCATSRATLLPSNILSANAYLGAEPIVEALAQGADVVITGRVADSSLFLAPLVHEHRLVGGRLDASRARRGRGASPGVRRAGDGRVLRRSDVQGRHRPRAARLPDRRGGRGRRDHRDEARRHGRDASPCAPARSNCSTRCTIRAATSRRTSCVDISEATITELAPDRVRVEGVAGRERPVAAQGVGGSRATGASARGRSRTPDRVRWRAGASRSTSWPSGCG